MAWGESLPLAAPPLDVYRGAAPSPLPLYIVEGVGGKPHPSPGATLPLSNTTSSSVVLGEALPENCKFDHHAVVLPELSLNFSSPLAGSRRRRRPRAVHVLNSEVPYVRYLDWSDREDVQLHQPHCHNASAYGLRGYMDNTLPSCCYAITIILCVRRIFF